MAETGRAARDLVREHALEQVSDDSLLEAWLDDIFRAFPGEVARYRAGEKKLLGFLVGRLMEQSQGRADPKRASALLRERLEA
jgi:aspartyl-tRNA(Asn)/glutamyl-tRNA(Gln) amidotransferase subunit B